MPLSRYSGTFEPEDLEFLQRVFDKVAKQRGLSPDDTEKAEKLAAEIVLLFSQGAVCEADLMRGLARCGDRPPMLVTIRRIGDGLFSVDWTMQSDAVTIRVLVPRSEGLRIYSDTEQESIACKKAQDIALNFAESLVGEKCVSMPAHS
jgi:hypothetical protein